MLINQLPADASSIATAPSTTRSALSTSIVKSTWPGVSTRLMEWSAQGKETAADWMVMPGKKKALELFNGNNILA